jgi:hypothetical protein
MPTFDIWLEDSTGRQFRRSNHYQQPGDDFIPDWIFCKYFDMCRIGEDSIKVKEYTY